MDAGLSIRRDAGNVPAKTTREPHRAELTAQQRAALAKAQREADIIKEAAFAVNVTAAVPLGEQVGPSGWKIYLDQFVRDADDPSDPIERLMLQQLALAHYRVGELHAQAAQAQSVEAMKLYSAAATRLTGELRRLALALRQYRCPIPKRSVTFVRQQNVAGSQQVAYVDHESSQIAQDKVPAIDRDSELENKGLSYAPTDVVPAESKTSRSRSPEPQEARSVDGRRP
jgi:hypothetical protein